MVQWGPIKASDVVVVILLVITTRLAAGHLDDTDQEENLKGNVRIANLKWEESNILVCNKLRYKLP